MAEHLTEEEQIETIKRWFKENWLSVVMPIVLAIFAYTGWNFWTERKAAEAALASEQYGVLLDVLQSAGNAPSEEQRNEALSLADGIRTDFDGSLYADLSALLLAKLYVDKQNYEQAEQALRDVLSDPSSQAVESIANVRLAQVLMETGAYAEALALVSQPELDAVKAIYAETRGDIFLAQGETAAANTAYAEALSALSLQQSPHRGMLQFKFEGTKVRSADVAALAEEPQAELVVETADAESTSTEN